MPTTNQVTTFKELVLAHHAYQRSLQEFAQAAGIHTGYLQRQAIQEVCAEIDPREVDADTTLFAIESIKEA